MIRIESEMVINADIQKVWEVMVHTPMYSKWNPFITSIKASQNPPKEGTEMEFIVCWDDGSTQETLEVVDLFSPPQKDEVESRAEWSYSYKSFISTIGLVRATRQQILVSKTDGITHYFTFEEFRGWGLAFLPVAKIQDGFDRQAEALKSYCEQL